MNMRVAELNVVYKCYCLVVTLIIMSFTITCGTFGISFYVSVNSKFQCSTFTQFNTLGIEHFEYAVAQILISWLGVFKCPNHLDTQGKNKLWKRAIMALEHLHFLTYGVKLPILTLSLMSNLCSLGCIG